MKNCIGRQRRGFLVWLESLPLHVGTPPILFPCGDSSVFIMTIRASESNLLILHPKYREIACGIRRAWFGTGSASFVRNACVYALMAFGSRTGAVRLTWRK